MTCRVKFSVYRKLNCRRQAAPRSVSLNILPRYSRSCEIILLTRTCVSSYYTIVTYLLYILALPFLGYSTSNNGVPLKYGLGLFKFT